MAEDLIGLLDLDDGGLEVSFEDEVAEEGPGYDEDAPNLVEHFMQTEEGEAFLKKLGDQIDTDFDSAWESAEEYRQKIADNFKIYSGFLPEKTFPYKGCSNAHVPILLEGISRLSARTYAELFLQDDQVYAFQPTSPEHDAEAQIAAHHTNWQIWNQITDFTRQMHRGMVIFFTVGDITSHSFYDSIRRTNCHEMLTCDEFNIPYVLVTTQPDYSDVPFKTKILSYHRSEITEMQGEWTNVDKILARKEASYDDEPDTLLRMAHAEAAGIALPDDDRHAPYKLYLYDGKIEMPGEEGYRAIQAIWDPHTKTMARLFIREENDWRDQIRWEREVEQGEQYNQSMQLWEQEQQTIEGLKSMVMGPNVDPMEAELVAQAAEADALPAPEPPLWMQEGKLAPDSPRRVPIEMFAHGVCMENMLGNMGLSYGQILADQNRAINNNFNLFNDQASMSNASSWLVPDIVDIEPGTLNYQPGSINRISGISPAELKNSLIELKPAAANQQLIEAMNMMYEFAQSSVAASDILSGEPGKSGETFRGQATRLEQVLKQLSVAGRKFADFLVQIGRNNCKLNSMYLDEEELIYVTQKFQRQGMALPVGKKLYQRNYKVNIRSDLRFASQAQRISESDHLVALPGAVPPLQGNLSWWYGAAEQSLKARGLMSMIPLLGPRPPDPTTPLGVPPPPPPGMAPPPGGPPQQGGPPPPPQQKGTAPHRRR